MSAPADRDGPETSLFSRGQLIDIELHDFDSVAAAAPGWDIRFLQLGAGPMTCSMRVFHTSRIQFGVVAYSVGYTISGRIPRGGWSVDVADVAGGGVVSGGIRLGPLEFCASNDRRDIEIVFEGPSRQYVLSVEETLIAEAAERLWNAPLPPGDRLAFRSRRDRAAFVRAGKTWIELPRRNPKLLADPRFAAELEYRMVETLLRGCEPLVTVSASAVRHAAARKARAIILEHLDRPLGLADLCARLHVNERTLQLGFAEIYGMGPIVYARQSRLAAARQELREGNVPIAEVAVKWGFFHPGRFSDYYRAAYGYPPSKTPRGARLSVSRMNEAAG